MVASKILRLYTSVWEPLLSNDLTGNDIIEFSKLLPKLRAALSCCVCNRMLTNEGALLPSECREHFACKACLGKERDDNKKCNRCDDWSTYQEDESLTTIIKSYQDFCFFFLTSERIVRVLEIKHEVDPKFDTFQLIDIVREGLNGFQRAKRRKLSYNAAHKKTSSANDKNEGSKSISNESSSDKGETKKIESEGPQEKVSKAKSKSNCEVPSIRKSPPPHSTSTNKPFGPVKSAVTFKNQSSTSGSNLSTPSTSVVEKIRTGASSPPMVTIKVEVQTTPEKQQVQNEDNESLSSSTFSTPGPDRLVDPLGETSKSPTIPIIISRPTITSTAPLITTSACNVPSLPYRITPTSVVSSQSNIGPQIIQIAHPTGIKTVSIRPQQIRLAGIPGRGGIPVQIFGNAVSTGTSSTPTSESILRAPIVSKAPTGIPATVTGPGVKRRIIFTTATPHDLQRWPDTSKILQFATGDLSRFPSLAGIRPSLISVGQSSCPIAGIRTVTSTSSNIRPVATNTTLPLVRPQNSTSNALTTINSASLIGQTTFTSTSNQGQGLPAHSSSFSFARSTTSTATTNSTPTHVGSAIRPQALAVPATTVTRQVPVSSPSSTSLAAAAKRKPEGCRCGNATPTPGKLTCIGQRCACYADRNACSDCKCKGCKNPYVPGSGGKKVFHGVRAFLEPQPNQTIPIIATSVAHGPTGPGHSTVLSGISSSPVATQSQNTSLVTAVGPSSSFGTLQAGISASTPQPMPPFQFIPVRFGPSGTPQYLQITNPHALHQMPIILSTSGHLQTNPSSGGITFQGIPISGLSAGGIHHISQIQQQRPPQPPMNIKHERNCPQE